MKKLLLLLLISVSNANSQNLALNKPVYASSVQSVGFEEAKVNDGDYNTFWSSSYNDDEWIYIDLQGNYQLREIKIHWEGAYAKRYTVEISSDNSNYQSVFTEENGNGGIDSINLNSISVRYLKVTCLERGTVYGNAINEIEVLGQRYADGIATDQDGNTFEWINYGSQDWAIENAKVINFRDGTPIPQLGSNEYWNNINDAAWCYYNNDPTKGRIYNWYAVKSTKSLAPYGWRVPSDTDWSTLVNYLIANGYNYDGTTIENKIAKSMASVSEWDPMSGNGNVNMIEGMPGFNQSTNNSCGFNALPQGWRNSYKGNGENAFENETSHAFFWSKSNYTHPNALARVIRTYENFIERIAVNHDFGLAVRFVRDAQTASTKDYSKPAAIYPNPTTSIINIEQNFTTAKVYDISGRELLKSTSKTIDLSELPSSIYLLRLYDNSNKVLGTSKVVKQ